MGDFRAMATAFAQSLGAALGAKSQLMLYRSTKSVTRSMELGRMDLYFVPPSVAVAALDNGYSPVARVRDQASGVLVRLKGADVTAVALTEKEISTTCGAFLSPKHIQESAGGNCFSLPAFMQIGNLSR